MLRWLKCVTRLKSYRCTSTSQNWILLSLIKQDDPKATGGLRHFSRGENWILNMLVHGNSTIIIPQRCLHLGLRADATAVPEVGWDLVGLVCSFWWLLSFPGNNPGPAYGKEDTAERKECSWEKCSQQIHARVRKWTTDPCSGKILSMKGFVGLQSTSLHKGGGRQHGLSHLLLYFSALHKRFEKLLWKCWPLMYKTF